MPRAAPLPLDERRAALIAATEPLLEQYGREVSTRQIAEAAGVAEGTIFRAFPTKEALIDAALEDVFDNQRIVDELLRIDLALPLRTRLTTAVALMQGRLRRVFALFHSMRLRPSPDHKSHSPDRQRADAALLDAALEALLAPDRHAFRMPLNDAASVLRTVTFALTHPMIGEPRLAAPDQVVDLLLDGLLAHHPPHPERPPC